jgi:hypothetical protein
MSTKQNVFICYSHADKDSLERVQVHLKPLVKQDRIDLWDDTKIKAGEKWKEKIEEALSKARIAILLISADFLASDFIIDNELPRLLEAAKEKDTFILIIKVKACYLPANSDLRQFQAIHNLNTSVAEQTTANREVIYSDLFKRVEEILSY